MIILISIDYQKYYTIHIVDIIILMDVLGITKKIGIEIIQVILKWNETEHSRWFKMATKIFDHATLEEIKNYIDTFEEKKRINKKLGEFHKKWGL